MRYNLKKNHKKSGSTKQNNNKIKKINVGKRNDFEMIWDTKSMFDIIEIFINSNDDRSKVFTCSTTAIIDIKSCKKLIFMRNKSIDILMIKKLKLMIYTQLSVINRKINIKNHRNSVN